jgi:hypothetical protein
MYLLVRYLSAPLSVSPITLPLVLHRESLLGHIRDVSSVTVNVPNGVHVHQNQPTDGDIPHA